MSDVDVEFKDLTAAQQLVKDVRSDASPLTWVVFHYVKGTKKTLEVAGSGTEGLEELHTKLTEDKLGYGLLRVTDRIDNTDAVKFVFIIWTGKRAGVIQKGRMATHKGSISTFIGQFHVDVNASSLDEVTSEIVSNLVGTASGSKSHVIGDDTQTVSTSKSTKKGGTSGGELQWDDKEGMAAALAKVRSADDTDWALFSYQAGGNTLGLAGFGSGGADAMKEKLTADGISYGMIRVTEKIDNSTTVKFVLVQWCGENVPIVRKARVTTQQGAVWDFLGQYHTDVVCSDFDEISSVIVENKVAQASGRASNVLDVGQAPAPAATPAPVAAKAPAPAAAAAPATQHSDATASFNRNATHTPSSSARVPVAGAQVNTKSGGVTFADQDEAKSTLAALRSNSDPTDWMLLTYIDDKSSTLKLCGSGSGGLEELRALLHPKGVFYGLMRTTDRYDNTEAVKFVYIFFLGENLAVMRKARVSTHAGAVKEFFGQFHVDLSVTNTDELTAEEIKRVVQKSAGTANFVL